MAKKTTETPEIPEETKKKKGPNKKHKQTERLIQNLIVFSAMRVKAERDYANAQGCDSSASVDPETMEHRFSINRLFESTVDSLREIGYNLD